MNDLDLSWVLQILEGTTEVLKRKVADMEEVEPDKVRRLVVVAQQLSAVARDATE